MDKAGGYRAYVGLGSNLHEPLVQLRTAIGSLASNEGMRLSACSSFYRTAPVGYAAQPHFINEVVQLDTELSARGLLDRLLGIERAQGRIRNRPNGPRTLDLDLLLFATMRIEEPGLSVPHPRMHERAFVLIPLLEIAPDITIPGHGRADELLMRIDRSGIERIAQ